MKQNKSGRGACPRRCLVRRAGASPSSWLVLFWRAL